MSDTADGLNLSETCRPESGCGCCEGNELVTPVPVYNRHGKSSIDYRVGQYRSFREAMVANLSNQRALDQLTTRANDDYTIALLDAWAQVADVLTFYQERIANEGFLATATERRSLVWLASALGYVPTAGVAAAGLVSLEMETAAGAPEAATIPEGLAIQSLPGPGEEPQTYETTAEIEARPVWNAMPVRTTGPAGVTAGQSRIVFAGTGLRLGVGDGLLLVGRPRDDDPTSEAWELRRVVAIETDQQGQNTAVDLDRALGPKFGDDLVTEPWVKVFVMRSKLSVFGHNAMDWDLLPDETKDNYLGGSGVNEFGNGGFTTGGFTADAFTAKRSITENGGGDPGQWPGFRSVFDGSALQLDGHQPDIVAGSWLVVSSPTASELYRVDQVQETAVTDFGLTAKTTEVTLVGPDNNDVFDGDRRTISVYTASERLPLAPTQIATPIEGAEFYLADQIGGLEPGRQLLVVGPQATLQLLEDLPLDPDDGGAPLTVLAESLLTVTAPSDPLGGGPVRWAVETSQGRTGTVVATPAEAMVITAPANSDVLVEPATLDELEPGGRLRLGSPLANVFDRAAVRVHANVAPVTHGASTSEVLGSGRAAAQWQRFRLSQKPLTAVPSAGDGGASSTLEIRVNEVLWSEVRSLALAGPNDRVYTVDIDDDGSVEVLFGDGATGARLPTGTENVVATYRVGSGRTGLVAADQLTLLVDRPLGLKGVTNPLAPDGAADPEAPEALRSALPGTVKTFDRLVSLLDHEDYARSFPGVAKATATWLWNGATRLIHVTAAGEGGDELTMEGTVLSNLSASMASAAGHFNPVRLGGHEVLSFSVKAGLFIDPAYEAETVVEQARQTLLADFAFERRRFGQPVSVSDLSLSLHIPGVLGVDIDELSVASRSATDTAKTLIPQPARLAGGEILPAQLLVIDGAATVLEPKS